VFTRARTGRPPRRLYTPPPTVELVDCGCARVYLEDHGHHQPGCTFDREPDYDVDYEIDLWGPGPDDPEEDE
jgi:hypothetical protein